MGATSTSKGPDSMCWIYSTFSWMRWHGGIQCKSFWAWRSSLGKLTCYNEKVEKNGLGYTET